MENAKTKKRTNKREAVEEVKTEEVKTEEVKTEEVKTGAVKKVVIVGREAVVVDGATNPLMKQFQPIEKELCNSFSISGYSTTNNTYYGKNLVSDSDNISVGTLWLKSNVRRFDFPKSISEFMKSEDCKYCTLYETDSEIVKLDLTTRYSEKKYEDVCYTEYCLLPSEINAVINHVHDCIVEYKAIMEYKKAKKLSTWQEAKKAMEEEKSK